MAPPDDLVHEPFAWGRHGMPGLWRHLLPEDALWLELPEERCATCDDCPEVARGVFRADCQCCTYFPQIPNFMLGLALRDPNARAPVAELIAAGHATPQGLLATPRRFLGAVQMEAAETFGNDPAQNCPFLEPETRGCQIYAYRNSVCSTFFCDHDHGDEGAGVWSRLQGLMGRIEIGLSHWAMTEVGFDSRDYLARLDGLAGDIEAVSDADGAWSLRAREALWGTWLGREIAFFEACADRVLRDRERLFEIAKAEPYREALRFERAVREWLPEAIRDEAPEVSDEGVEPPSIHDLTYKLDLAVRHLWELPFHEGRVSLAAGVALAAEPEAGGLVLASRVGRHRLTWPAGEAEPALYVTPAEARLLGLFRTPQVFGEALFERPEIEALEDARAFLAQCLRRGVLHHDPS
jgi:Fe-S-cluster containining protein